MDLRLNSGVKGLQMELHEYFREIESTKFQSKFMIFSGFKLVRNALSRDKVIVSLINEARLNPAYIDAIGKRILFLSKENKDKPGSTFDIAVAAYLSCLFETDQHFAKRMSEFVLEMGKLWWSVDLALHISRNMELFADPGKRYFNYIREATPIEYTNWTTRVEASRMKENVPFLVNGEELCNMSGRFSVRSPQKTKTQMLSV